MPAHISSGRTLIAVTGAQGVGKSTFCRALADKLRARRSEPVFLLEGLGDAVKKLGLNVGSNADSEGVAAVYAAHIRREREAPSGIVIMDRCVVDALAYVRGLGISTVHEAALYTEITLSYAKRIDLLVRLELSEHFRPLGANHETTGLREFVSMEIPRIIDWLDIPSIGLDAYQQRSVDIAIDAIESLVETSNDAG